MDKKITLFNKNHITVTREDNGKNFRKEHKTVIDMYGEDFVFRIEKKPFATASPVGRSKNTRPARMYRNITLPDSYVLCKSEFGFYYSEPVEHENYYDRQEDSRSGIAWTFIFPDYTYEIRYLTKASDKQTAIDNDTRPWQLVDGSMEEHFIFDLLDEVTKICDRGKELKYKCYNKSNFCYWGCGGCGDDDEKKRPIGDAHWAKSEIFKDLFGNAEGPKFQTNDEKILAHGFDLVTSFRKM